MNKDNYASLEASQRLHDAGIVLDTEVVWCGYRLQYEWEGTNDKRTIPAPSMAEVWRELPELTKLQKGLTATYAWMKGTWDVSLQSYDNPTDALIDLLIWVRKEAGDE